MIKRIAQFFGISGEIGEDHLPGTRPLRGIIIAD